MLITSVVSVSSVMVTGLTAEDSVTIMFSAFAYVSSALKTTVALATATSTLSSYDSTTVVEVVSIGEVTVGSTVTTFLIGLTPVEVVATLVVVVVVY